MLCLRVTKVNELNAQAIKNLKHRFGFFSLYLLMPIARKGSKLALGQQS